MKPSTVLLHLIKTAAVNGVDLGPTIMPGPKPLPGPSANPVAPPRPAMLPSPSTYMKAPAAPGRQPGAYGANGQLLMASGPVRPPLAPKAGPQAAPTAVPAPAPAVAAKAPAARPVPPAKAPAPAPTELERMNSQTNPGQAVADRWKARDAQMKRGIAVNPQQPGDNLTTAQLLAPPSPNQAVTQYNPKLRLTPGFEEQRETQAFNQKYRQDRAAAAQPQVASR